MNTMHKLVLTALIAGLFCGTAWGQAHMTDAQADGLKGKVKEVSYELQRIEEKNGKSKTEQRFVSHITTYDQKGRELVSTSHSIQGMFEKTIYLEIDGHRAMKSEMTRKESGHPPMLIVGPVPRSTQKPDPRYEIKYLDTYDERGNRTEVLLVGNDGRIISVQTYKFDESGNQIEWGQWKELEDAKQMNRAIVYPKRNFDKLPQRTIEVEGRKLVIVRNYYVASKYDATGSLTDSLEFDDDGKISRHVRYGEYEFDALKNWIKRTNFRVETKNGKEALIPEMIEYQVIKYYP